MIPTINLEATGDNMRKLMDERNMTVKDVAEGLGFGCVQGIYKWLHGRGLPSVDNLVGLSHIFQVRMEDILVFRGEVNMTEYVKIPNIFKRETFGKNKLIEGKYSLPELEYLKDAMWEFTEKIDGTNIRVCWDGYRVSFMGRTDKAQIPAHLLAKLEELFGGESKEELFEQTFGKKEVILFGEGYGKKIQKGGELYGDVNFRLFDVLVDGYWLLQDNVDCIAEIFEIETAPFMFRGTLEQGVQFIKTHPKSLLRDAEMEGIVGRPMVQMFSRTSERIMVKIKCRDF